jgi:hypothetical protein
MVGKGWCTNNVYNSGTSLTTLLLVTSTDTSMLDYSSTTRVASSIRYTSREECTLHFLFVFFSQGNPRQRMQCKNDRNTRMDDWRHSKMM